MVSKLWHAFLVIVWAHMVIWLVLHSFLISQLHYFNSWNYNLKLLHLFLWYSQCFLYFHETCVWTRNKVEKQLHFLPCFVVDFFFFLNLILLFRIWHARPTLIIWRFFSTYEKCRLLITSWCLIITFIR